MSAHAPTRAGLVPAAAAVSILVLLLGAVGLFSLFFTNTRSSAALARQTHLDEARTAALETQINFKTQVQEWKNILLRGGQPADYTRYLANFEQRETAVQTGLASVKSQLTSLGLDTAGLDALATTHRTLGADYRTALATWSRENPSGAFAVDTAVRGRDRQLGEDIDTLADTVAATAARELHAAGDASASLYANMRRLVQIVSAVAILAALGLVFAATRTPRALSAPRV